MACTAKDVMALREKTGAGVMDCKKALTDADGDMTKAAELLRERGIAKADKKASRIAAEGIVACYIDGKKGVLVELNCESDFVAKNPQFAEIATEVAKVIIANNPADVDALLTCACSEGTVEEYLKSKIAIIGEKIAVRRFVRYETEGFLKSYIHLGGIKKMKAMPGVMFVVDPHNEDIAIKEAKKLGIKIVAITDTNCDPDEIDYVIPGNDDAIRAIKLISSVMANAVIEANQGEEAFVAPEVVAEPTDIEEVVAAE